jgi:hypothetical protein
MRRRMKIELYINADRHYMDFEVPDTLDDSEVREMVKGVVLDLVRYRYKVVKRIEGLADV